MSENRQNSLPPGWAEATLGDLASILRGVSYRKEDAAQVPAEGLVPIIRATNIGEGLNFNSLVYVPQKYVHPEQFLRIGDIVLAASSGSRSVVGKAALLTHPWIGAFGTFCFALRPSPGASPKLLGFYLQTKEYRNRVSSLSAGVNINNLKTEHIETTPFPLPPVREQQRIAEEIEKQFTRLEAGVEALKRVRANLKRYRASVLKAACEGRLVPTEAELARAEGREYEPADKLLARILKERRARWEADQLAKMRAAGKPPKDDKWKAKYKEPTGPQTANLPKLQEGWVWASLDQTAHLITSGSRGWANYYADAGALFVRAQDINTDRLELGSVARVQLPPRVEGARTLVQASDLLVTITGANVTKTAIVRGDIGEAYVSQHVGLVRLVIPALSGYLYCWVIAPSHGRRELERLAYGAGKPGLNLDNLRELLVAIPPLPEQCRVIAEVERCLSVIDELEAVAEANLKRAERLRQAILKRAFEGKLVPQDPSDEPASVLLERIRAERAAKGAQERSNFKRMSKGRKTTASEAGRLFQWAAKQKELPIRGTRTRTGK